jgi:hypothetical protein
MVFYLYRDKEHYYYHTFPPRVLQQYVTGLEYLGQVKQLSQMSQILGKVTIQELILSLQEPSHVQAQRKEDSRREKLRQSKLGEKNPNKGGLRAGHREKISQAMKGKYMGSDNINFGKPRRRDIRAKISQTKKLNAQRQKYRWALSPQGTEHLIPNHTLPEGYIWGRKRFVIKLSPKSLVSTRSDSIFDH